MRGHYFFIKGTFLLSVEARLTDCSSAGVMTSDNRSNVTVLQKTMSPPVGIWL